MNHLSEEFYARFLKFCLIETLNTFLGEAWSELNVTDADSLLIAEVLARAKVR